MSCLSICTTVAITHVIWQADSDKSWGFRLVWREYQDRTGETQKESRQDSWADHSGGRFVFMVQVSQMP